MSEDLVTNVDKPSMTDSKPEFARRLREARESKGLTTAEVADRLNLSASTVRALEEGDLNRLPSTGFVRGYIRSYAQVLDLDAEELISDFDRRAPDEQNLERISELYPSRQKRESRAPWIMVGIVGLLGVVVLLWGALRQHESETLLETFQHEEEDSITTGKSVPEKTPQSQPQPPVNRAGAEDEPGDLVVEKKVTQDLLVLRTKSQTWVEVYGANGERLLFDMLTRKKSPVRVFGRTPFSVVLGNSPDVTLQLNGQTIDQSRFNRPSRTATFIVDAEGALRRPEASVDR
jgi:cytoskeleton protein RodZ